MPRPSAVRGEKGDTRERILDVALDLFVSQGFDKTSLREVAERLGVTKAALYYHFASKDDILLALHLRLHEVWGESAADVLAEAGGPKTAAVWREALYRIIDAMTANSKLFLLHERNRAALEALHDNREHQQSHTDLEERVRHLLGDPALPLRTRVRMSSAFGAVLGGMFVPGVGRLRDAGDAAKSDIDPAMVGPLLREIVDQILGDDL